MQFWYLVIFILPLDRFFRENLSPMASEACAVVDQIRFEEQQTLWTNDYEDSLATDKYQGDVYPGMMFSLAKDRMEKSKLWRIVRRMPKGCLLHCHFEAMIGIDWTLERAFALDNVHIQSVGALSSPDLRRSTPFTFSEASSPPTSPSIWSSDYVPNTPVPLNNAADTFPDGGRSGFIAWAQSRTSITPEESLSHHHGPNDVWKKFLSTFLINDSIIYILPILRNYVRQLCRQLHEDNILWADVRAVFYRNTYENPEQRYARIFQVFQEEIEAYKASEEGKGFWGLRFIWTAIRICDKRTMIECLYLSHLHHEMLLTCVCSNEAMHYSQEGLPRPARWFRFCRPRRSG
jgi:adenosine deaminase CECR1